MKSLYLKYITPSANLQRLSTIFPIYPHRHIFSPETKSTVPSLQQKHTNHQSWSS